MAIPARVPVTAGSKAPKPPAAGGHYVKVGNQYQLIHAVGPGKWAKGPVPMVAGTSVNNPLLNPGQPLSGKSLGQAALALTNAQTQGPLTELAQQIAASNRQTQGTMKLAGGYYNQLGGQAQQGVTDEQGIANNLNAALQRIAGGTNQQLQGIGQNAQSSLLAHAPQGEGGLAASALGSIASETARQQGLAAQQQGNQQAFGANQGANYSGLAATGLSSNALAGTQALRGIAQSGTVKNEPLLAKVADLQASQGGLLASNEGKLRQQEINNSIAAQGLGLKSQSLKQAAAQDAARNALTARGQNITLNGQQLAQRSRDRTYQLDAKKFGAAQAADAYARAHGLGKYRQPGTAGGPKLPATTPTGARTLTPLQQQRDFGDIDTIRTLIPQMQAPLSKAAADSLVKAGYNVQAGQKLSETQIRHLLQVGVHPGGSSRYNPALVDSAYALAGWGYLTNKQITELNKLGLIVGNRYRRGTPAQSVAKTVGGAVQGVANAVGGVFK